MLSLRSNVQKLRAIHDVFTTNSVTKRSYIGYYYDPFMHENPTQR